MLTRAASGILALMLAGTGATTAAAAPPDSATMKTEQDSPGTVTSLPPGGNWILYNPKISERTSQQLVRPVARPCPAGTTNYPAPNEAYSCLSVYSDNANSGHPVGLRQGRSGGFGYLHALQDHDVDEETIGTVIANSAAGIAQGNDRYLYGLRYEVNGVGIIAVEVIEDRKPSGASPDNYALGVVTAYCKGHDRCPPGVNESIP
ncbi:MAG: hypothetical protein ACRDTE_26415 [Pseudonocardiaceae bacterium]